MTTPNNERREEIARIIDTYAARTLDIVSLMIRGDISKDARHEANERALNEALDALCALPPLPPRGEEPVAWETRHMYGNNEWSPWEKTSQVGAERWRCDPSFKNGRREVRDLYEAPKSGAVAGHEPAAWGLIDPETGEWKSNKLFHRQADAEQSAVNLRNSGLELEARPLYAAPPASTEAQARVDKGGDHA